MVCVPCVLMPVLLFLWHRFIQPIVLKFWNPWKPVEKPKNETEAKSELTCPWKPSPGEKNTLVSSPHLIEDEHSQQDSITTKEKDA